MVSRDSSRSFFGGEGGREEMRKHTSKKARDDKRTRTLGGVGGSGRTPQEYFTIYSVIYFFGGERGHVGM